VGDYALIHAGFAISLMGEDEALETLKLIKEVAEYEIS
jgi:hydrogenase maturation factor